MFKWIKNKQIYSCFGVLRNRNNYNSGVWSDGFFTSVDNQSQFIVPTTPTTQTIDWMVAFHTEECRKVYNIIAKYNTGDVTKEDAKKELADAVTHKTRFTKPIQDKVNEIMKEEQPKAKTKKIVTEN